jgi:hypothetical protein
MRDLHTSTITDALRDSFTWEVRPAYCRLVLAEGPGR